MSDYHVLFCQMYEQEIEATKTPEQLLLLQYFKEAGENLPVDSTPSWFFSAWRKIDVIYGEDTGSKDMVAWHLLKIDDAIHRLVDKFEWPESERGA